MAKNQINYTLYHEVNNFKDIPLTKPIIIKGIIHTTTPLKAPLSQKPAIYYKYELEEKVEKQTDDGNTLSFWKKITKTEEKRTPCTIKNTTGNIAVNPHSTHIEPTHILQKVVEITDAQADKSISGIFSTIIGTLVNANLVKREREYALFEGEEVYIFGKAKNEDGEIVLENSKRCPLIITKKTKEQMQTEETTLAKNMYLIGAAGAGISLFLLAGNIL
jgi:hypothetical protein